MIDFIVGLIVLFGIFELIWH